MGSYYFLHALKKHAENAHRKAGKTHIQLRRECNRLPTARSVCLLLLPLRLTLLPLLLLLVMLLLLLLLSLLMLFFVLFFLNDSFKY
jgi:hypothetical protein